MELVADSNIVFLALMSGKPVYLDIFRAARVSVPDFMLLEIEKYIDPRQLAQGRRALGRAHRGKSRPAMR